VLRDRNVSAVDRYQYRPPARSPTDIMLECFVGGSMPYTKELIQSVGMETTNLVNTDNGSAEWGTLRFGQTADL